jgi:hypothetical protein
VELTIPLTPFTAKKVKFISPRSGRNEDPVDVRLDFMVADTEEASAPYDTATFTVDGSSKVTTTKKIRAYASDGTNYAEATLNIHICGDETI